MSKKLRFIALLLVGTMMMSMLAACGSSSSSSGSSESTAATETTAEAETEQSEASESTEVATAAQTSEDGTPVYGGSLTLYFNNLNTMYDPSSPDFANYMFWFEQLFAIDWSLTDDNYMVLSSSNMTGQIAESWEWDEEAMTFTVTIRDDIYFQTLDAEYDYYGGRNLVATDIKWSYDRVLGTGSGYDEPVETILDWRDSLYMVESITTEGDYTVIFQFNTDSDAAVNDFIVAQLCIAGPEWDELTAEQQSDWHYCCGTGPYILTSYTEGTYMVLTRNDNYYDYDERYPENKLPYLDEIILVKIDDNATLMAEFIAGDVDFIGNNWSVFSSSEAAQIMSAMSDDAYATYTVDITGRGITLKQTSEPLTDINVRKALQYAINLEEIAVSYFGYDEWNLPTVLNTSTGLSSYSSWSDELVAEYLTYDPDLARELLAEAGYADGFTIEFAYVDSGDSDLYLLVKQYLADVGVTLELNAVSTNAELVALQVGDNETCTYAEQGGTSLSNVLAKWNSSGSEYALGFEDVLDSLIATVQSSASMSEQSANAIAVDQYIMENHYVLSITPSEQITYFVSGKVSGYGAEDIYIAWNIAPVMARVWSSTGE